MKKFFIWMTGFLFLMMALFVILVAVNTRERHKDYFVEVTLPPPNSTTKPVQLFKAGLAKEKINPPLPDTWTDVDSNARYEPSQGDTYQDGNGNGRFDPIWMAGFGNKRAANGIHDDLWARAIVLDDGVSAIGLVVLDAIGFFYDDVIAVRKLVAQRHPEIQHVIIASTHSHQTPDLQGLWGKTPLQSGVNPSYRRMVHQITAQVVSTAWQNRIEASLAFAVIDSLEKDVIADFRKPIVYDEGIRLLRIHKANTQELMSVIVNLGNHPETAGDKNLLLSSDIFHYLREGIESGIVYDGQVKRPGVGGMAVVFNGAVGGLMSGMSNSTHDRFIDKIFAAEDHSFDKVRAQGYRYADQILQKLDQDEWTTIERPLMRLKAKTFTFKLDNRLFKLASGLGVVDRGIKNLNAIRSEINLLTIGPLWLLTIPGEINPELIHEGIEAPAGRDFLIEPVEIPPIRQMMDGEINWVVGLANDEVGYIMPKSHWDQKPPFTYDETDAPYGEVNSLGPETGPKMHRQAKRIIEEMRLMHAGRDQN